MDEFLNELKSKQFRIREEMKSVKAVPTAGIIAVAYGYMPVAAVKLDIPPYPVALLVSRARTNRNEEYEKYLSALIGELEKDGYSVNPMDIVLNERRFKLKLIMGKQHDAGGTAVMDRKPSLNGNPVAIAGYMNGSSVMGFMLDTAPEHYADVWRIAELLEMEPKPRIPDVFLEW